MKKLLIVLFALALVGCGNQNKSKAPAPTVQVTYQQITEDEALQYMQENEGYLILDVRTPEEFAAKHIKGAINVPNETIGTSDIEQLPDKEQVILVYCRSGNRSKQASEKLVQLEYTNIIEFGGINNWNGETEP